ncbi:acyl-CoA dehydrogenase family protein [Mycobacterium sp. 1274756.6]|uniref:acyl-CoA dehydrogenase family protein n=1 Tax=Mycobacterium sp. 1274756.6 TaxID=1834076 RepID=UPI0007FC2D25|nr:acyl-CoA dehydrogenase family protein [Mycobacterium sp. 1274756.6]OBJ69878.1 acyl-CoA dehydrogenase [Mycobacterium sp. 1274756.6]
MSVRAAVQPVLPAIAAAAADIDRDAAVPDDLVAALAEAGMFTALQPTAFGGAQTDPDDFLGAVYDVAAACTSTGWLAAMLAVNAWHVALFDPQAQQDVWGDAPRALACASYAPTGRLEHVPGGFILAGRWARCSGVRHARWLVAGALVVGADGAAEDFTVALVPHTDYRIETTWDGLGLRGIGAEDVVVTGAFVPDYRTFGWVSGAQRPTLARLYRLPQPTLYTHAGTAPAVGAALGLLGSGPARPHPLHPLAMAEAGLRLAVRQMSRNIAALADRAEPAPAPELMLRTRRDQVLAFERAMTATAAVRDELTGPDDERAHRVWRDILTARLHVANDVDRVLSTVGEAMVGLPVDDYIL